MMTFTSFYRIIICCDPHKNHPHSQEKKSQCLFRRGRRRKRKHSRWVRKWILRRRYDHVFHTNLFHQWCCYCVTSCDVVFLISNPPGIWCVINYVHEKKQKNLLYSRFPIPIHEQILNSINFSNTYIEKALKYIYLSVLLFFFFFPFLFSIKRTKLCLGEARKKVADVVLWHPIKRVKNSYWHNPLSVGVHYTRWEFPLRKKKLINKACTWYDNMVHPAEWETQSTK